MEALLEEAKWLILFNTDEQHKESWSLQEVIDVMAQAYLCGQNSVLQMAATEKTKVSNLDPFTMSVLLARSLGTLEALYGMLKLPADADRKVLNLIKDISKATNMEHDYATKCS